MKAATILLPILLAACGSGQSVTAENASVEEVQAKIKEAGGTPVFLKPGRWESTMSVARLDVPGMPPALAQRLQKAMAGKTATSCLTPEEAKKPAAEFFAGQERKNCRYEHFRMDGGTLDAKMACAAEGASATVAMKGTYEPESFRMSMDVDQQGVARMPQGAMTMAMTIASKRTGDCDGSEGKGGPAPSAM